MKKIIKKIKSQKFLVSVIVIITILNLSLSGCIENSNTNDKYFYPLELLDVADQRALDWKKTAKLVYVHSVGEVNKDGKAKQWRFTYMSANNDTKSLEIIVGPKDEYNTNKLDYPPRNTVIKNWTVTTDKILKIARQNAQIKDYLSKYPKSNIEDIAFVGKDNGTWTLGNIQWVYNGDFDSPKNARIWIDCTDGEVIEVEADS